MSKPSYESLQPIRELLIQGGMPELFHRGVLDKVCELVQNAVQNAARAKSPQDSAHSADSQPGA